MFDQRNQSFQSIILSASVMFAALSTVIIQGFLPPNANEFIYVSYALTCSLSFAFLFLSVVLSIEVILRASSFMYHRARRHTLDLKEAITKTKAKLDGMRNASTPAMSHSEDAADGPPRSRSYDSHDESKTLHSERTSDAGGTRLSSQKSKSVHFQSAAQRQGKEGFVHTTEEISEIMRQDLMMKTTVKKGGGDDDFQSRQIARMSDKEVQKMWEQHEEEIQEYLNYRVEINDKTAVIDLNILKLGDRVEVDYGGMGNWIPGVIVKARHKVGTFDVLFEGEERPEKRIDEKYIRLPNGQDMSCVRKGNNLNRKSFEQFWTSSCGFWADAAISFFYIGTVSLLLAIMLWMWAFFLLNYESFGGAVIAVIFIGVSLIVGLYLVVSIRNSKAYSTKTSSFGFTTNFNRQPNTKRAKKNGAVHKKEKVKRSAVPVRAASNMNDSSTPLTATNGSDLVGSDDNDGAFWSLPKRERDLLQRR